MAREAEQTLGTAALYDAKDYGEVKSMFVADAARGKGVGEALLAQLEATARKKGLSAMKLETGNTLHAAHRLYERAGFTKLWSVWPVHGCGQFAFHGEGAVSRIQPFFAASAAAFIRASKAALSSLRFSGLFSVPRALCSAWRGVPLAGLGAPAAL